MNHLTTRRTRAVLAGAALLLGATALVACGGDDDDAADTTAAAATTAAATGGIEVTGAWARTSPSMTGAGAAYLVVTNTGSADDALVSASVDASVAASVELHETVAADGAMGDTTMAGSMGSDTTMAASMGGDTMAGGGMMTMQPVDKIPVPAGGSATLEPGGYHIMLMELAKPLEVGQSFDMTLNFEKAGAKVVTVEVRDEAP